MFYWYEILFIQVITWAISYVLASRFGIHLYKNRYVVRSVIAFTVIGVALNLTFSANIFAGENTIKALQQMAIACFVWTVICIKLNDLSGLYD